MWIHLYGITTMGTMVMGIIVPRSEKVELEGPGWFLVFGRRKTGKTFMIREMVPHDKYFFVLRGGLVLESGSLEQLTYPVFRERISALLKEKITLVIDEFQRLPEEFLDLLHYLSSKSRAKVILVGSSLSVTKDLLTRKSPLLGIVKPVRVGLINPVDILRGLSGKLSPEMLFKVAPYLRDPWILRFIDPLEFDLSKVIEAIRFNVPALVGEVFEEEDRMLTDRYELIMRALSLGNSSPGEIASYISGITGGGLKGQDVKSYLANLTRMGLVERVPLLNRKRYIYRIGSPLIDLFYYLDSKLGYYELDVPMKELINMALIKEGFYYEDFIIRLLAQLYNARIYKSLDPEIDGILFRKGKMVASIEVKLGGISRSEIAKFAGKVPQGCEKIVVAKEGPRVKGVKLLTPPKLVSLAMESNTVWLGLR